MELNTRCPECETVFPVSLEQLQLRKGYIRCIQCANIFDAYEAVVPESRHTSPSPKRGDSPQANDTREAETPSVPLPSPVESASAVPSSPAIGRDTEPVIPPYLRNPRKVDAPVVSVSTAPHVADTTIPTYLRRQREPGAIDDTKLPERDPEPFSIGSFGDAEDHIDDRGDEREPKLPSVLRQRGDPNHARSVSSPSFSISDTPAISPGRNNEPVIGVKVTVPKPDPNHYGLVEPGFAVDDEDAAPSPGEPEGSDFLFVEPRPQQRSERYQPPPFDGTPVHRPWMKPVWLVLIVLGLGLLLAQGLYIYRAQLANSFPGLRPVLEAACAHISCSVPYERQIDAIAITGSALRSTGAPEGDVSSLTLEVTLRNTYVRPQEWPTLVLDLKDASGTLVVRRNLPPDVWVPAQLQSGPFEPGAEMTVQVPVSVRGVQANGYQLDKFFP